MFLDMNFPVPDMRKFLSGDEDTKKKKLARLKNARGLQMQLATKLNDGLSRYGFEGIDDDDRVCIDERFLKLSFIYYPGACFFEKEDHVLAFPSAPSGDINPQGNPGRVWWFGANGQAEETEVFIPGADSVDLLKKTPIGGTMSSGKKAVFVRENPVMYPFFAEVLYYSEAIADTMRTLDVARRHIKRPYLVAVRDAAMEASIRRQFDEMDDNIDTIVTTGMYDPSNVNILPFNTTPDNLNACTQLIEWYESKWRERCGFDNNAQMDKKGENLIQAEISVNDEYTELTPTQRIESINQGLAHVNKLFGTHIKCVPRKKPEGLKDENDDISRDKGSNA